MKDEVYRWNVDLSWELFTSGIYFYRKALSANLEHQKSMYCKSGILSIVTSVEVYINQLLIKEENWSKTKVKETQIQTKFKFFNVDDELYKKSKNLRNIYIVHFKERDHTYFNEINIDSLLEAIESAQEIIALINFNKKRLFPYWITGVNFINPNHNYDIWLSNDIEFWHHMKWSGYLLLEIYNTNGNIVYEINDFKRYKSLYFDLWDEIKKSQFNLKFYKDKTFINMSVLSCDFWD